jgi:formylglycine-generating enzyme required for sulfatase activity/predicted Ser/Thr protein kinase
MIDKQVGDYTITKSLGKGGFGTVWEAKSGDGNLVAIKILNPQVLENEKVVRKFFHEAMILAKLDHPNICKLMEFFPEGNNYCIVMEYVQGNELKKIIQQQKLLPFELAFKIAKQSLAGFQYAHESGILHRDIKPANIMIDKHGNAKIMDFGIAKMSTAASHDTAASMLSIFYVPPERLDKSREIDAKSDVYSLGLVFYEMFAGRRPFSATETAQIMFCHLNEIPDPPSKYATDLTPAVSQAISKSLEKDPDDRFPDFRAFSEAMGTLDGDIDDATYTVDLDKGASIARSAGVLPSREVEVVEKKKKPMALIASVLIALIIAGAGAAYFMKSKSTPKDAGPPPPPPPVESKYEFLQKNAKGFDEFKAMPGDGSTVVLIPEGEFTMGSDKYAAEKPVQSIYLDKYYIDKYLVTNEQFQKFVNETGYETDADKVGAGMVRIGRRWKKVEGTNWKIPDGLTPIEGREDHPVSQVSFNDALAYCQWAQKDLPTEAQWEKAARGPNAWEYPWDKEPDDTLANFDNMVGSTTPVNEYEKGQSFFGLHDMAGNVYQWCKDWYGTGERQPQNPTGPESGSEHVIKGGSFIEGMESLRSANRDRYETAYTSFLFGFRCASEY